MTYCNRLPIALGCLLFCVSYGQSQERLSETPKTLKPPQSSTVGIESAGIEFVGQVDNLMARMTLEEKIGQLNLLNPGGGVATGAKVSDNVERKIKSGRVGGLFGFSEPEQIIQAQSIAINESRLKIPLLIGSDIIHGYKTTFPIPLATASSWDMEIIERGARVAAKEATADGFNWNFSPMVDIARDPRWGRIAEGAGEDPYLGSAIARAVVKGYQGSDLTAPDTMLACVKHFALYGGAEAGRDYNSVDMSRLRMFNEYFPPYKAAIDAGAATCMTSFNDVDGIPASGNRWLLTDLLRKQWKFKGMVVSDYTSVNEMTAHGLGDLQQVASLALNAGLDMDMVGEGYVTTLKKSLDEKKVTRKQIDQACRRVLMAKYQLGLFDDPGRYTDPDRPARDILSDENRKEAREAAKRTFVLMKNHNDVLPLSADTKIALVGPLADSRNNMLGTWAPTGDLDEAVTVLEGFCNVSPETTIRYAKGANLTDDAILAKAVNVFGPRVTIDKRSPDELLQEALSIADQSDVVVAVVGEASEMSGESASRTDISIPKSQKRLIRALVKTGKPVVLVLMSGRPLTIAEEYNLPVSILQAWFPGTEAGNAIGDVVFGNYNPSGKLTASWPRSVGQIPIYYSIRSTGRPAPKGAFLKFTSNYLDSPNSPLLPFGFGLSYTKFEYSNLKIDQSRMKQGESINVSVTLKNIGDRDGEEVAQLYLRDVVRSITPPVRQLKGFRKVLVAAGESKTVSLQLKPEDLKFYNSELDFVSEPGDFEIFVGGNSNANLKASFVLE